MPLSNHDATAPRGGWWPHAMFTAAICVLLSVLVVWAMAQERQLRREQASVASRNIAQLLTEQLKAGFDRTDTVLQTLAFQFELSQAEKRFTPAFYAKLMAQQRLLRKRCGWTLLGGA